MMKISAYHQVNLPERVQQQPMTPSRPTAKSTAPGDPFKTTLNNAIKQSRDITFSAHAKARLYSRGVELSQAKIDELSQAIDKAEAKGAKESLVLSEDAAYLVSVKNRTVITAFDRDNLRDGVFTSIDSAVIL